ncbi:MAG: glycosyltransferase [Ignavibacteriales bacterium]|nr:glycosyltransferase [Ignavibacteriales bacterium]
MKYSIIIPTLNEEKLLGNLLKDICTNGFQQKYDYEVIVSDGGSQDKTIEIANNFSDKVVTKDGEIKQNIAVGRNRGASQAKGEILIFLNADIAIPDLQKFFDYIENKFYSSKYAAMTCRVMIFPNEARLVDKLFLTFYNFYFRMLNVLGVGMGRGECHIVKREIFDKLNGYNEKLAAGEDFELFKNIKRIGKIHFANKITIYESPRRYRKLGHWKIFYLWLANGIYVFFKKKALSREWEQIR